MHKNKIFEKLDGTGGRNQDWKDYGMKENIGRQALCVHIRESR